MPPSSTSMPDSASQHMSPGGNVLREDSNTRSGHLDDATGGVGLSTVPGFVTVPGGEVMVGVDTDPAASFVWDLEGPPQVI